MVGQRHCLRVDTIELKLQIEMRLGRQKTEHYFNLLNRYFSLKISKPEFDKLCIKLFGRDGITLHNKLIRAVIRNAHVSKSPPPMYGKGKPSLNVKVTNSCQQSPTIGRTPASWNCKYTDRASPVWTRGKPHSVSEQQSATELLSLGSRPPVEVVTSVEEGEEIEQLAGSPAIHSRSPLRAPFGVSLNVKGKKEMFVDVEACYKNGELPDTSSLRNRLEQKLKIEGLNVSTDCAHFLNNGLDVYLKRLLKPCVDLASSRSSHGASLTMSFPVSMTDFRVSTESNPQILGEDWPLLLEKML